MSEIKSIAQIDAELNTLLNGPNKDLAWAQSLALLRSEIVLRDAKLVTYENVFRIIAMRSKMEGFVDKNYPLRIKAINDKTKFMIYGKPEELSYCDAIWKMIVSTNSRFTSDTYIMIIRQRLVDKSVTPADFNKFCRWLYNQFSDESCHKLVQFAPALPAYDDVKGIQSMFTWVEIDSGIQAVKCVQIILEPFS